MPVPHAQDGKPMCLCGIDQPDELSGFDKVDSLTQTIRMYTAVSATAKLSSSYDIESLKKLPVSYYTESWHLRTKSGGLSA